MNPVSITDTSDWICKCGHKHYEHLDNICMHGCYDDINQDACCECTSYETKQ